MEVFGMSTFRETAHAERAGLEPATYSLAEVARLLGVGYTSAHQLALIGKFPITPIRVGRQYRFAKSSVHRLLGMESEERDAAA